MNDDKNKDKIYNPESKKWVLKTGKVGKKLLEECSKEREKELVNQVTEKLDKLTLSEENDAGMTVNNDAGMTIEEPVNNNYLYNYLMTLVKEGSLKMRYNGTDTVYYFQ